MPRTARVAPGGFVSHALNRAVARLPLLQKDGDYEAFERTLAEALAEHPARQARKGAQEPLLWSDAQEGLDRLRAGKVPRR